ncbi:ParA family protein [Telmatospirillum sp. J64-1]|uniref:ParA family protein n=1 Tax=Telmatospirillum sp. J64-1 TaxID=2502183 RepID=UPI00115ED7A2|nr:ParA family protein [Telmatospirillum sp. J64-1]
MLSVLVANLKGGCGKTTIATHLAAAFAGAGFATAIADCDRQRSSLAWLGRRPGTLPAITGLDWTKSIDVPPSGIERLVIDSPAALRGKTSKDLVERADIVLVPVLPSAFDRDASARFLAKLAEIKPVRKNKRVVAVIGNRLRLGTKAVQQLDDFFAELGFPVIARLRDTQAYPAAAEAGSTLFEDRSRRMQPYAQEWAPVLDLVGARAKAA